MMDLKNIIDNTKNTKLSYDFNSCQLNFEDKNVQGLTWQDGKDTVDCIQTKNKKQEMLKEMFCLLAKYSSADVINSMARKYGSFFDQNLIKMCSQIGDLIGNYFITCRYNDDLGCKNKNFVKYVLMCDCNNDCNCTQQNINGGSVDGFFDNNVKSVKKVRVCKKHNLPVLANIEDLSQQDFAKLAKQVSQVKNIPIKQVKKNTDNKRVISKISKVFKNLLPKKVQAKIQTEKYQLKDANVQFKADVSKQFVSAVVSDVKKIDGSKMKYKVADKVQNANVNMPFNNVSVKVNDKTASMQNFTVTPNKCDEIKVAEVAKSNVNIPGKNIAVAVQKESKFVDNISIYTKPIKTEFDLDENYDFQLAQQNLEDIEIDSKGSFDF